MASKLDLRANETHPLFPSGEWEGFYTYLGGFSGENHPMAFTLTFKNGKVSGRGQDDLGEISWKGGYDTEAMRCGITKFYGHYSVYYDGHVDENGIWGSWSLEMLKGGFHIWPKKQKKGKEAKAKKKAKNSVAQKKVKTITL